MELILWRHAEAEDARSRSRPRTHRRGRKQAARMADWLNPRLPPDIRILASPAARALQTAQALGRYYDRGAGAGAGASAEDVLAAAGWPDAAYPVLIVGHQPTLGQVAMRCWPDRRAIWR
jgi:phosphohistidine phosphatase